MFSCVQMEDEHDPVVHRMNVFLSKRLCKNLLLLQYPVRSAAKTYDDADVVSARVKPRQHCVELELAVDVKGHCHAAAGDSQMSKLVSSMIILDARIISIFEQ
jgi:hypothetical protein